MSEKSPAKEIKNEENILISRMAINDNKAGMEGLDKEKINQVIMENTVGSRYYKNEQKRDAQVKERIDKMKKRLQDFTSTEKKQALQKADMIIEEIEKSRDLSRTILHIDMDAFYASVEERDKPELKMKPMAVGGMSMLSTSNYVARKYGVRAAMPGFIAMKLCPELTIVPLNFTKYKEVSKEIQQIYKEYDENFMAASLDEAYLDITDHLQNRIFTAEAERTFPYTPDLINEASKHRASTLKTKTFGFSAEEVAEEIRFRIHQTTKLTASAGIGPNLMLAKIGSDLNKPNGQTLAPFTRESIISFMKTLPLRKVSGIGKVSEQLLSALDIKMCGDLIEQRAIIVLLFSSVSSSFFLRAGLGCSSSRVCQEGERKSISTERTFNAISDENQLFSKLQDLCQALSADLQKSEVQGKTVTLKTKTVDFESHTRSKSLASCLSTDLEIFDVAKELLKQEMEQAPTKLSLRLMGVGLSKLEPLGSKQAKIKRFFTKPGAKLKQTEKSDDCLPPECDLAPREEDDGAGCSRVAETPASSRVDAKNHVTIDPNSSSANSSEFICPVCSSTFGDLLELNRHLDSCLANKKHSEAEAAKRTKSACWKPEPSIVEYQCPVCSVAFSSARTSLELFNDHVDSCLNRRAIKELLRSDAALSKRVTLAGKSGDATKSSKRRKIVTKPRNTIDRFFT